MTYSSLRPRARLAAWVDLLALAAADPPRPWSAPRSSAGGAAGPGPRRSTPSGPRRSRGLLADLVAVSDAGMREPLPLPVTTAEAWATRGPPRTRIPRWPARDSWQGKNGDHDLRREPRPRLRPRASARRSSFDRHLRNASTRRGPATGRGAGSAHTPSASGSRCCCASGCGRCEHSHAQSRSTSPAPCPPATTLLEASAGTGKTWTIASLVTRYVAEGHCRLDELLVVTFGRAASEELRLRRARAARRRRAGAVAGRRPATWRPRRRIPTRASAPSSTCSSPGGARRRRRSGTPGCGRRCRPSTGRPSPRRTSSARWC